MSFHIGDKVIHSAYGLGEIVQIEEKMINDHLMNCYVVRASELMVWIPIKDLPQHSLRVPALPEEFIRLYSILTGPGEELLKDRVLRKEQLLTQMRDGQLASIFRVVRDLTSFKRSKKLNDQERSILERATSSLLTEWTYSLKLPVDQAYKAMTTMLEQ